MRVQKRMWIGVAGRHRASFELGASRRVMIGDGYDPDVGSVRNLRKYIFDVWVGRANDGDVERLGVTRRHE
jgi:hypothetical protein